MENLEERLRAVLDRHPEIRFALLFGSAATRGWTSARDVDVAVSFSRSVSLLERARLALELEAVVDREVDVVDIDEATTLLRWEVVRAGRALLVRDKDALLELWARVPIEYADLRPHLDRQAAGLRKAMGL